MKANTCALALVLGVVVGCTVEQEQEMSSLGTTSASAPTDRALEHRQQQLSVATDEPKSRGHFIPDSMQMSISAFQKEAEAVSRLLNRQEGDSQ